MSISHILLVPRWLILCETLNIYVYNYLYYVYVCIRVYAFTYIWVPTIQYYVATWLHKHTVTVSNSKSHCQKFDLA